MLEDITKRVSFFSFFSLHNRTEQSTPPLCSCSCLTFYGPLPLVNRADGRKDGRTDRSLKLLYFKSNMSVSHSVNSVHFYVINLYCCSCCCCCCCCCSFCIFFFSKFFSIFKSNSLSQNISQFIIVVVVINVCPHHYHQQQQQYYDAAVNIQNMTTALVATSLSSSSSSLPHHYCH